MDSDNELPENGVDVDADENPAKLTLESQDPVDGNPFPPGSTLHQIWKDATQRAEQKLHLFNSAYTAVRRELPEPETLEAAITQRRAQYMYLVRSKVDIWAERSIHVVWNDDSLWSFDQWLTQYANAWLDSMRSLNPDVYDSWPDIRDELRSHLFERVEFWKSEARRYLAEQKEHSANSAGQTAKPSKKRAPHPKPPCFVPAANLLRENPQLSVLDFCRRMDSKAEQHPRCAKYLPPQKWKVRSFYDQYTKRSNTVSALLTRVRKELSNTSGN